MGKRIEALRIFAHLAALTVALTLLFAGGAAGQAYQNVIDFGPMHHAAVEVSFQVTSGPTSTADPDSVVLQLPGKYRVAVCDTVATAALPSLNWTAKQIPLWDGFLAVDLKIVNTDLAVDSLQVLAYALDEDGKVISNDYVYCSFATPPTYSTSATIKAWTTATWYRADLTGAFGKGTYGVLFIIKANDATASHYGVATLKIRL